MGFSRNPGGAAVRGNLYVQRPSTVSCVNQENQQRAVELDQEEVEALRKRDSGPN